MRLIQNASRKLNLDSETTITIAVKSYLKNQELNEELESWEFASEDDLTKFNRENEL